MYFLPKIDEICSKNMYLNFRFFNSPLIGSDLLLNFFSLVSYKSRAYKKWCTFYNFQEILNLFITLILAYYQNKL